MAQHTDELAPDLAEEWSEEWSGEQLPLIELETLLNRPPSWRKRCVQIGLMLAAAVVVLVLFWNGSPLRRPAPPADSSDVTNPPPSLFITSNVNYGTVTINGKKQPETLPMMIPARSDTYAIRLDAPPFRPISCRVRLSQLPASGISAGERGCLAFVASSSLSEFEVNIIVTLDDLPPAQQSQVSALLTRTLTSEQDLAVPAGSYIATSFAQAPVIASQRISSPLRASAIIAPLAPQNQPDDPLCVEAVCPWTTPSGDISSLSGQQWAVQVALALRWRFSSAAGAAVSAVIFQKTGAFNQIVPPLNLFLSRQRDGQWTIAQNTSAPEISSQLQDAFCATGENILRQVVGDGPDISMGIIHDQGAAGCEVLLEINNADAGTFLWRFGVLLAADAKAHATDPELPAAPPAEIAAIAQS